MEQRTKYEPSYLQARDQNQGPQQQINFKILRGKYQISFDDCVVIYRVMIKQKSYLDSIQRYAAAEEAIGGNVAFYNAIWNKRFNRALVPNDEKCFFGLESIFLNDIQLNFSETKQSMPILNSVLERIQQQKMQEDENTDNTSQLFTNLHPDHSKFSRFYPYRKEYTKGIDMVYRFYNFALQQRTAAAGGNAETFADQHNETIEVDTVQLLSRFTNDRPFNQPYDSSSENNDCYSMFRVKLTDLVPHLKGLTLDMSELSMEINFRLLDPIYCLHLNIPYDDQVTPSIMFYMDQDDSYTINDIMMSVNKIILPQHISLPKQIKQHMGFLYMTDLVQGNKFKTFKQLTLNKTFGSFVVFTEVRKQLITDTIVVPYVLPYAGKQSESFDYSSEVAVGGYQHKYNSTHYYLPYQSIEISIDNKEIKPRKIPVKQDDMVCYLNNLDGFERMFRGNTYCVDFRQFINNKSCIFIPHETPIDNKYEINIEFSIKSLIRQTDGSIAPIHLGKKNRYQCHIFVMYQQNIEIVNGQVKVIR